MKNIDDRNSLKPVYGQCVVSQLVSNVNNSSLIPPVGRGHSLGEGRGWGVYVCEYRRLATVNLTTVFCFP